MMDGNVFVALVHMTPALRWGAAETHNRYVAAATGPRTAARKEMCTMKIREILRRLDALICSRSILLHPFYVAWNAGELTREQLATYARVYDPHVASFPKHLKTAANDADDPTVQEELEQNL